MSAAEYYAQGLESAAQWVRANADALDAAGIDLADSLAYGVSTPEAWAVLAPALDGGDGVADTQTVDCWTTVTRSFGPIQFCLFTATEVAGGAL